MLCFDFINPAQCKSNATEKVQDGVEQLLGRSAHLKPLSPSGIPFPWHSLQGVALNNHFASR